MNLPDEMTLEIVKTLSAKEFYEWTLLSKNNLRFLEDISIWNYYAARDFHYPEYLFKELLKETGLSPYRLYLSLSQCKYNIPIKDPITNRCTHFVKKCCQPVIPRTSYCIKHCKQSLITMCQHCEKNVTLVPFKRFCRPCMDTHAYLNGCIYKGRTLNYDDPNVLPCGRKRSNGSDFCEGHRRLSGSILRFLPTESIG